MSKLVRALIHAYASSDVGGLTFLRLACAAGDEVYGGARFGGWGTFAEYAVAPAPNLSKKPACLSFEQAAAVPVTFLTAHEVN